MPPMVVRPGRLLNLRELMLKTVTENWRNKCDPQIGGWETGKPVKLSRKVNKQEALK